MLDPLAAQQVSPANVTEAERVKAELAERLRGAMEALDGLIGLEPVKRQVAKLQARYRMEGALRGGRWKLRPMRLVFAGPPGTGKTTVARSSAEMFPAVGLLERATW